MKRAAPLLALLVLAASACNLKDAGKKPGTDRATAPNAAETAARVAAARSARVARTRSLDGAAGQLRRYQEGSGGYAGAADAADPGAVLFDGARARSGAGAVVVPASYAPRYSPRPRIRYTNYESTIPSDLALAPPPSPAEARDVARYASLRASLIRSGATPSVVDQAIRQAVRKNMDPLMVLAIGMQESHLHNNATSAVGARGAMQLMPGTACDLGVCNAAALYNPAVNVSLGTTYFKNLWHRFVGSDMLSINPLNPFVIHRVENAIAAYNAGPGAVRKYGGVPPYRQTANYVRKVMGYYTQFRRYMSRTVSV